MRRLFSIAILAALAPAAHGSDAACVTAARNLQISGLNSSFKYSGLGEGINPADYVSLNINDRKGVRVDPDVSPGQLRVAAVPTIDGVAAWRSGRESIVSALRERLARKIRDANANSSPSSLRYNTFHGPQAVEERAAMAREIARLEREIQEYPQLANGEGYTFGFAGGRAGGEGRLEIVNLVLDPDRNVYAFTPNPGQFHHSSPVAGGEIAGAAEAIAYEGKILFIYSNASGHYRPTPEQGRQMETRLREMGVLHEDAVVALNSRRHLDLRFTDGALATIPTTINERRAKPRELLAALARIRGTKDGEELSLPIPNR